jgi:hypothetical protein
VHGLVLTRRFPAGTLLAAETLLLLCVAVIAFERHDVR